MSLRMEEREPVLDILQQTPAIPETAQWALFLRNHDELTLEMVTDEERDYMYRTYAQLSRARLNLGIRRRLAPLLGNDRRRIELLNALLFSLPGTPVIYYGDEIGMGENIYLGDRNGVRTPMQWSADRNAGFSRANPHRLYLPINIDPDNHYEAVNVDVQQGNPHSLLWWTKRLITLRKRWGAFGLGTVEFIKPENRKIFACVRRYQNECILILANLSRFAQPAALDLTSFAALTPVELFGRTEFPVITEKPYFVTLGPHAFYWFSLESKVPARVVADVAPGVVPELPLLSVEESWEDIFSGRDPLALEAVLQNWLRTRPGFGGANRTIKATHVREAIPVPTEGGGAFLVIVDVEFVQTDPEMYLATLACALDKAAEALLHEVPSPVLARLNLARNPKTAVLYDALADKAFCRELLAVISARRRLHGGRSTVLGTHTAVLRKLRAEHALELEPSVARAEQGRSAVVFGDRLILKFYQRILPGPDPEVEMSAFLTARRFPFTPPLAGSLEYQEDGSDSSTLAVLSAYIPKSKSAWEDALDTLGRFYERVEALPPDQATPPLPDQAVVSLSGSPLTDQAHDLIGTYLVSARSIGERLAALHLELASEDHDPSFIPEPFTTHYQRGLFQSWRSLLRQSFQFLGRAVIPAPEAQALAREVLGLEPEILKRFRAVADRPIQAMRTRFHGDFHLGRLVYDGKQFWITGFEGEPTGSLGARRLKHTPILDVADMIWSFHFASHTALRRQVETGALPPALAGPVSGWSRFWGRWVSAVFLRAYRDKAGSAAFVPGEADLTVLLNACLLRRALCEIGHELVERPERIDLTLQGVLALAKQPQTIKEK
jgi:maltose alpha-D-glucosyltransferase/alpha-amylase